MTTFRSDVAVPLGPEGAARARARVPSSVLAAVAALAGLGLYWIAHRSLADDAYITASYARNLALHGEWALVPGIPANSATSPLNVVLLAGVTVVVRDALVAIAVLLALTTAITAVWLRAISSSTPVAVLGTALLLCSPLLSSTIGLESYLAIALLVGAVRYTVTSPRWAVGAVLCAALVTTRPDLAVAVVVVLVVAALHHRRARGPLGALVLAGVLGLVWPVVSWWRLGSAVSDTLPAKSVAGGWGDWEMANGLGHYLGRWWLATALTLLLIALGLLALVVVVVRLARRHGGPVDVAAAALGFAGLADYAALSALRVAPFFWYYSPVVAGLGLTAALAVAPALRRPMAGPDRPERRAGVVAGVAATAVVVLATVAIPAGFLVASGMPWDGLAPIRINWATPAEYRAIAEGTPDGATVESPGEVGVLAWWCDERCRVVDYLSDPGRMAPYVAEFRARNGHVPWDLVYAGYRPPAPVPASLAIRYGDRAPDGTRWWPVTFPGSPTKAMWIEPSS